VEIAGFHIDKSNVCGAKETLYVIWQNKTANPEIVTPQSSFVQERFDQLAIAFE
jgi:hypothetical protein